MTVDKTEARATNQNKLVERIRDRIILKYTDLLILVINLENPQRWKESAWDVKNQITSWDRNVQLRMQSARTATKLDTSTKYASSRKGLDREPTLFKHHPRIMMTPTLTKMELDSQGITGKAPQVPNHQTPQGTLQAPYSG